MGEDHERALKNDFAEWLQRRLGYQSSEVNVPASAAGARARVVAGVRGESYAAHWRYLRQASVAVFVLAVVLRNVSSGGPPPALPNLLTAVAGCVLAVAHLGRARTRRYLWAECRDLGRPISCRDIERLHGAATSVSKDERAPWTPAEVAFVAGASGFQSDAVTLARSLGVQCFRRGPSAFERIDDRTHASPIA